MLKVVDLLKLPSMGQGYIVAGHDGMMKTVKKIEIMEEPYPSVIKFLESYGFMLTNFWSMENDKEGRINLVKAMIDKKCAGLGIMPGPHLNNRIDPEIIAVANQSSFPILYIPSNTRWGDMISEYGVFLNSGIVSAGEARMEEALGIFADFHFDNNVGRFCEKLGKLLGLPLIMSTDTVFSSNTENINIALAVAKIQNVCKNGRETMVSPITVRIEDGMFSLVYFGKRSMAAVCIGNVSHHDPQMGTFKKIASAIVKELDRMCSASIYKRNSPSMGILDNTPMYIALVKKQDIRNIEKKLKHDYIIYEKNIYFNYCIILIPDRLEKRSQIYDSYRELMQLLKPDLFIFSQNSYGKREFQNEIEPLKYMLNMLSYLKGIYSIDELPLLQMLSYVPYEYKEHMLPGVKSIKTIKDEDMVFLDTLRLYLVIHNIADVAGLLGIHGNSVKYRAGKALKYINYKDENILGEVPSIRLLLMLEFLVIQH